MTTSVTITKRHLAKDHNIIINALNFEKKQHSVHQCIIQQKTLHQMDGKSENNKKDQRFFIAREAVLMVCSALLPFQIMENTAFRRFFARTSSKLK